MSQQPKTNNSERKLIKYDSPKHYRLPGLSQFSAKLKIFFGFEPKLKIFLCENCNLSGVLNKFMQLKRITNRGRRQAIFVIFQRKKAFLTPFGSHFTCS